MCQWLTIVEDDGIAREIANIRDLRDALPAGATIVRKSYYPESALSKGDCCLCPVDLNATGAANGCEVKRSKNPGRVMWRR